MSMGSRLCPRVELRSGGGQLGRMVSTLFLVGLAAMAGCTGVRASSSLGVQLLIPLYSCPSDEDGSLWRAVEEAASLVRITIIWGVICEGDNYRTALQRLGEEGVRRLAYIATSDSSRPLEEVEAEISFYSQFPIDGIFLDEVSNRPAARGYNEAVIGYARRIEGVRTVVLNSPYADATFVRTTSADTVVVFEDSYPAWDEFDAVGYNSIASSRLAALIHGVPPAALDKALSLAVARGIGLLFVTDRGWDLLPSYFHEEVELVMGLQRNRSGLVFAGSRLAFQY